MSLSRSALRPLLFSLSLGLVACGDSGGGSDEPDAGSTENPDAGGAPKDAASPGSDGASAGDALDFSEAIVPLTAGSTWTYRVTDSDGTTSEKVVTAEGEEVVGGDGPNASDRAMKLVADRGNELTVSWVASEDGLRVVRYREQVLDSATSTVEKEEYYDPARIVVDVTSGRREAGESWLEVFAATTTDLKDSLPAETIEERENWQVMSAAEEVTVPAGTFTAIVFQKSGTTKEKTYWYVPGVGKVKETGGQTEELSAYDLAP